MFSLRGAGKRAYEETAVWGQTSHVLNTLGWTCGSTTERLRNEGEFGCLELM